MKLTKWLIKWVDNAIKNGDICEADATTLMAFSALIAQLEGKASTLEGLLLAQSELSVASTEGDKKIPCCR